jgi:hypothetical protein
MMSSAGSCTTAKPTSARDRKIAVARNPALRCVLNGAGLGRGEPRFSIKSAQGREIEQNKNKHLGKGP